jgi:hypothetical protein
MRSIAIHPSTKAHAYGQAFVVWMDIICNHPKSMVKLHRSIPLDALDAPGL